MENEETLLHSRLACAIGAYPGGVTLGFFLEAHIVDPVIGLGPISTHPVELARASCSSIINPIALLSGNPGIHDIVAVVKALVLTGNLVDQLGHLVFRLQPRNRVLA